MTRPELQCPASKKEAEQRFLGQKIRKFFPPDEETGFEGGWFEGSVVKVGVSLVCDAAAGACRSQCALRGRRGPCSVRGGQGRPEVGAHCAASAAADSQAPLPPYHPG